MRFAFLLSVLLVWPAFGSECFCLVDDAGGATWFDCREIQARIFCFNQDTGKQEPVERRDLMRVADGEPICTPCRLSDMDNLKRVIRGEDGEEGAPSTPRPADGRD